MKKRAILTSEYINFLNEVSDSVYHVPKNNRVHDLLQSLLNCAVDYDLDSLSKYVKIWNKNDDGLFNMSKVFGLLYDNEILENLIPVTEAYIRSMKLEKI